MICITIISPRATLRIEKNSMRSYFYIIKTSHTAASFIIMYSGQLFNSAISLYLHSVHYLSSLTCNQHLIHECLFYACQLNAEFVWYSFFSENRTWHMLLLFKNACDGHMMRMLAQILTSGWMYSISEVCLLHPDICCN